MKKFESMLKTMMQYFSIELPDLLGHNMDQIFWSPYSDHIFYS